MDARINLERLRSDLEDLAKIGRDPQGGISRPSFSRADLEARDWLRKRFADAGLTLREDGAGNIFGRMEGEGAVVMTGSHIDSVLHGGMFDGPAGVLAGLECLRVIQESGLPHRRPLEVVSFTDEEGNLTGDFLGSRAFTGTLDRDILEKGVTAFGHPLEEILKGTPYTLGGILSAGELRPEIEAFVELHIEQGPVLETEEKTIGIVDRIAGKNDWLGVFRGQAGHAGTTPFELRRDAFLGLADFALRATQYVAAEHYGSMLTVGRAALQPGAFSIVPGRVDFTLDFRSASKDSLRDMETHLPELARDIAATRGLEFSYSVADHTDPVLIPDRLTGMMKEICESEGWSHMTLPSGAGHDAQILAEVTDSSMIFIPTVDGISHAPEENILWDDLKTGADLLLQTLLKLAE